MKTIVVANVELLRSYGVSMDRICIDLVAFPSVFSCKPEIIATTLNELWELKLRALRDMGYSESDILSMFRRAPIVFAVSIEKMKMITESLVATGKFNIPAIVDCPMSLCYSFKKRYEPRMRILGILESKNIIENWPSIRTLGRLSNAEFLKIFVSPYSDRLSDVCVPKLK